MHEDTIYVGVDVSKDTFDVFDPNEGHRQFQNDLQGIKSFNSTLTDKHWVVMEATGTYHYRLAMYLFENVRLVTVENPLVVKRFIQMQLQKNKSDKSDAQMLSQYGKSQTIEQWLPVASHYEDCQQLMGLIQLLFKQKTAMKNKAHSLGSKGEFKGKIKNVINRQLRELDRDITVLERQLEEIIREHENDLYTRMQSIPGMGRKTALVLIATTQGFTTFKSAAQVIAYLGLAPTHRNSGSSVRGKSRISKTGDPKVRNHLFMCSFTACQTNPQCRALYQRLINKGKSKKLALIAVANKLIRQAFALAQNGLVYDPNYQSVKA